MGAFPRGFRLRGRDRLQLSGAGHEIPEGGGPALYVKKAFGVHFITFLFPFAVMSSGVTPASTAARAFAENLGKGFGLELGEAAILGVSLGFMALVAPVNWRGVGESVKTNVVFTCIELTGLMIVICIGVWAITRGEGDLSKAVSFEGGDKGVFWATVAATTLAFFAMVGFEDSVNMVEESKRPSRDSPRMLFGGLAVAAALYVAVSVIAVALVPVEDVSRGDTPLLQVAAAGAPWFPLSVFGIITMFAVGSSALINMLMASRLVYGMSRDGVLPAVLGKVHAERRTPYSAILFTTGAAAALITFVGAVPQLGGATALLLLAVFTIVSITVLVLRSDRVEHDHFRAPAFLPVPGSLSCAFLVGPWTGRDPAQYAIAGALLGLGVICCGPTRLWMRRAETTKG